MLHYEEFYQIEKTSFLFDYLTDTEGITEDNQVLDDLFEIHFHAIQYNGETITPYVDPGE